ncbi:MAG: DUF4136 domain-containing protein [bacterium]|nr:DUF4136 domain-containing protein [bacterium]
MKVPVKPMPELPTKVYSADDYDWAGKNRYKLELRETGRTDTVTNQILEKYLANQIVKCLCRKGWVRVEDNSDVTVRVFFGVGERSETSSSTLVYGSSVASSSYLTGYGLIGGLMWNASQLAATSRFWSKTDRTIIYYEGSITVEFTESGSNKQIWRGDARMRLGNDDVRLASGLMIRELLWQLPSYDYPPVQVPVLREEDFEGFWRSWVVGREFSGPGQRYPITFDYAYYEAPRTLRRKRAGEPRKEDVLREARAEFRETQAYGDAKRRHTGASYFDGSEEFWTAFEKWVMKVWNPREATAGLLLLARAGVASADLLMHTPWSIKNDDESIVVAGRYFIGEDTTETLVAIWAKPFDTSPLEGVSVRYDYQRYYITRIELIQAGDFKEKWRAAADQRRMAFGRTIDFVPPEPLASPPTE